jgi:hypothetical protein
MITTQGRKATAAAVVRCPDPVLLITRHFAGKVDPDAPKVKQQKSKKGKASKRDAAGLSGRGRDLELILSALDAPISKPPPADAEEMKSQDRVMKEYTIGRFKQHNQENHDLAAKLRMKQHAIKMLPRDSKLKEAALEIDDVGPPRWRNIPAWTAPIPGFDPNKFQNTQE